MQSKLQMENQLMVYGKRFTEPFRADLMLSVGHLMPTPMFKLEQGVPELCIAIIADGCGQKFLSTIRRMYRNDTMMNGPNTNIEDGK